MKNVYVVRRENLRLAIDKQFQGNSSSLAEQLGFQQPSLIYRYLSEKSPKQIGQRMARKIERVAALPENWMDVDHAGEMGPEQRVAQSVGQYKVTPARALRVLRWAEIGKELDGTGEWISTTEDVSDRAYATRVPDDSMINPHPGQSFPEGTLIIVDPGVKAMPGDLVIARQNPAGEYTFKKLVPDAGHLTLRPLNPQYRTIEVREDTEIHATLVAALLYRRSPPVTKG